MPAVPDRAGGFHERVTWVECPRDAWQGLRVAPPTSAKVSHLRDLLAAGFDHLDLGSFVSPKAVPQMADTEAVLAALDAPPTADLLCIVGNLRGLERATRAVGVTSVGYPLAVSDTFQRRNVGTSVAEAWEVVGELLVGAEKAGIDVVLYVSMGFGNPYGDPWDPEVTAAAVARARAMGVKRVALADTLGDASAEAVGAVLSAVDGPQDLGLHLHSRPRAWVGKVETALTHGVRWLEGALAGVGGCPFAADELVGNLPTESVLPWLADRGFLVAPHLTDLARLSRDAGRLAGLADA